MEISHVSISQTLVTLDEIKASGMKENSPGISYIPKKLQNWKKSHFMASKTERRLKTYCVTLYPKNSTCLSYFLTIIIILFTEINTSTGNVPFKYLHTLFHPNEYPQILFLIRFLPLMRA